MSSLEGQFSVPDLEEEALRSKLSAEDGFDRDEDYETSESRRLPDSVARFTVVQPDPTVRNGSAQPLKEAVIVTFDDKYLKTCNGIIRAMHVVCIFCAISKLN